MWNRPPDKLSLAAHEAHVWRISLDELRAAAFLPDLSPEEAARNFLRPGLKDRYVCAHGALRRILARYCGLAPAAIRFCLGAHGKPYLEPASGVEFNLSHSGALALVAVARGRAIGVDVERIHAVLELLDIARRMFPAEEADSLIALAQPERDVAFFRCWTRLEAHLKAAGGGLGDRPALEGWSISELDPGEGYTAALAIAGAPAAVKTWEYGE